MSLNHLYVDDDYLMISVIDEYILVTFEWLMNCVIIEYVTWLIFALGKFVECCDFCGLVYMYIGETI
jgi:hypothetical protein